MFELDKLTNHKCYRCAERADFQVPFEIRFCAQHFLDFLEDAENNRKDGNC